MLFCNIPEGVSVHYMLCCHKPLSAFSWISVQLQPTVELRKEESDK